MSKLSYITQSFIKVSVFMIGSQINSKVHYSQQTLKQIQKQLKAIKYPVRAISNAVLIKKKLGQLNPTIRQKLLKKMDKRINAYRQVRGDGNCFFRALAFSIISSKQVTQFREIFTYINDVPLVSCKKESIPKQFHQFYKENLLKEIFKAFWQTQINFFIKITIDKYGFRNYKRALARMITENPYMDFLIILYFRAVCLMGSKNRKEEFKQFLQGTEEDQIATYGEESEGVILNLMSKIFEMNIVIYQVRKDEIVSYQYNNSTKASKFSISSTETHTIYLLFYDNHYDLFQINSNPLAEFQDQKIQQDYYQAESTIYIKGTCIECGNETEVNQQNGLCLPCFRKSMQNLNSFQKDRMVEGFCNQCLKQKKKVSEQMQLCESCLQDIQFANNSRVKDERVKGGDNNASWQAGELKLQKCKKCRMPKPDSELDEAKVCFSCLVRSEVSNKNQKSNVASKMGSSKLEPTSPYSPYSPNSPYSVNSSNLTTLQNKLESKMGREQREREEEAMRKTDVQGMSRGKMYDRSKPLRYECKMCKKELQSWSELPLEEQLCKECFFNSPASKLPQSMLLGKNSTIQYKCQVCKQPFESICKDIKLEEQKCLECLKNPSKSYAKSEIRSRPACKMCLKPEEQFQKFSNGVCLKCQKGVSTLSRR